MNFQRDGSLLHYGQKIENCTLERLWNELKTSSDILAVQKEVEQFNTNNRWKKRGVAIIPTKFGISFTAKFMNQAIFCFYTHKVFVSSATQMVNLIH